ncbi:hypothetical protein VNO77_22590 [Canavalia gladiata]|uniref:Uncharacterized protein n=1 Tax=Canavalia gladiata TaxID=3824 RepID=A0AAN9L4A3_CANGL
MARMEYRNRLAQNADMVQPVLEKRRCGPPDSYKAQLILEKQRCGPPDSSPIEAGSSFLCTNRISKGPIRCLRNYIASVPPRKFRHLLSRTTPELLIRKSAHPTECDAAWSFFDGFGNAKFVVHVVASTSRRFPYNLDHLDAMLELNSYESASLETEDQSALKRLRAYLEIQRLDGGVFLDFNRVERVLAEVIKAETILLVIGLLLFSSIGDVERFLPLSRIRFFRNNPRILFHLDSSSAPSLR